MCVCAHVYMRACVHMQRYRYLGESAMSDALAMLSISVQQEALTPELKTDISRRISDRKAAAQGALEALEAMEQSLVIMVDSIVKGEADGDTRMWSVLMLQDDLFGGEVRLKHVHAVFDYLKAQMSNDEYPSVHSQYVCHGQWKCKP